MSIIITSFYILSDFFMYYDEIYCSYKLLMIYELTEHFMVNEAKIIYDAKVQP